jgi:hypothetical protein
VALLRYNVIDMLWWQLAVAHAQFWSECITFQFFALFKESKLLHHFYRILLGTATDLSLIQKRVSLILFIK